MTTITTFLAYDHQAEAAAALYTATFPHSKIVRTVRRGDAVLTVEFQLEGKPYVAMNGGAHFQFSDAISLCVNCETQAEIDRFTAALIDGGGAQGPCGWVKDRFGVSWQLVPAVLPRLLSDADPERAGRVMAALMQMTKLDLAALERAHAG